MGPESYWIPSGELTFTALQRVSTNKITIENEWDFIWLDGIYSTDNNTVQPGTDTTHGGATILLQPSSGNKKIMSDPVPISHLFRQIGVSTGPKLMHYWSRFEKGSTVTLDITNLINATVKMRLTFIGIKVEPGTFFPLPDSQLAFQL